MTNRLNPYPKRKGFGFRYLRAKALLERYGRNCLARPCCRSFDNCFENFDGDAVVWALMRAAVRNEAAGDPCLGEGIRRLGKIVWPEWMRVYEGHGLEQQIELPSANQQSSGQQP
jgi:hypothetical protein